METSLQTNEQGAHRASRNSSDADVLHSAASLARELNGVNTAPEAFEIALRGLSRIFTTDYLCVTVAAGEDRQQFRASLDQNGKFENADNGAMVGVARTMLERVVQTGAPVFFDNLSAELLGNQRVDSLLCPDAQAVLCAPLMLGAETIGIITASTPAPSAHYTDADADVAAMIANVLAATLKRIEFIEQDAFKRRRQEMREQEERFLEKLHSTAQTSVDLEGIVQSAIDALARALPASFIVLRHVSFGQPEAVLRAWTPGGGRPSIEIHAPVSRIERAVYTEQRPVFIADARAEECVGDADLRPLIESLGARAIYFSPITSGGQILAAIGLVEADAEKRWSSDERSLLARFAEIIAPLILNAQLSVRSRSFFEDLLTLLRLAGDVTNEAELDRCLHAAIDSWSRIAGADALAVLRWDQDAQLLRLAAMKQLPTALLERYTQGVSLTDPLCGLAATERVGVIADLAGEARFAELYSTVRWSGLRGAWATPIIGAAGKLLGMLITFSRLVTEISAGEQHLADLLARPIAIAIEAREQHQNKRAHVEQVKHLGEKLQQSEQYKTEFMYIISHELRTPLNAIIGYAQMLKDGFSGELNEQQRVDVQTIIASADRLLHMVEDALDLARIDAQRFPMYMDAVAFEDVVRRAVAGVRPTAEAKGLDIKLQISEDAPIVRTDPERVRQVLTNLLSNAIKFTESGFVQVSVERMEAGHAQIKVTDTGIGFDTVAFPHIFDDFRQVDASTTRMHGGTGLGLAVSKRLVQRLGGHIGVTSVPGEGSTFWFQLPPEIPGAEV